MKRAVAQGLKAGRHICALAPHATTAPPHLPLQLLSASGLLPPRLNRIRQLQPQLPKCGLALRTGLGGGGLARLERGAHL